MGPEVAVALITTIGGVIVALLSIVAKRMHEMRAQVQNGHKTPLRSDIDRVITLMEQLHAGQRRHERDIREVRADLRTERHERMALAEQVAEAMKHGVIPAPEPAAKPRPRPANRRRRRPAPARTRKDLLRGNNAR